MNKEEFKDYLMKKYTSKTTKSFLTIALGGVVAFISFLICFIWKIKVSLFTGCIGIAILLIGVVMWLYIRRLITSEINKFKG